MEETEETEAPDSAETVQDSEIPVTEETENPDAGVMLLAAAADFRYNVSDEDRKTIEITGYTVTGIGEYAFEYCEGLTGIEIPEGVTSNGKKVYGAYSSVKSVKIKK